MDSHEVWTTLLAQGTGIWFDELGKLRIEKSASDEIKNLVRQHKAEITAILAAQDVLNRAGVRGVRLVGGARALAIPPGAKSPDVLAAIAVLDLVHLPLVHETRGRHFLRWNDWVRTQVLDFSVPLCDPTEKEEWLRRCHDEPVRPRRKTA